MESITSQYRSQNDTSLPRFTFVVEHLDAELEGWSTLEYSTIAQECRASNCAFILSSVPEALQLPPELRSLISSALIVEHRSIETLCAGEDHPFTKETVCLLDPKAAQELSPSDAQQFSAFLFGGILGDDPPRDRTGELRAKGFPTRRLGPVQMTTDTAVRVTRTLILDQLPLESIPYVDYPEIKVNKHESVKMPFRYVKGNDGPVMPNGMSELIASDSEKGIEGLL